MCCDIVRVTRALCARSLSDGSFFTGRVHYYYNTRIRALYYLSHEHTAEDKRRACAWTAIVCDGEKEIVINECLITRPFSFDHARASALTRVRTYNIILLWLSRGDYIENRYVDEWSSGPIKHTRTRAYERTYINTDRRDNILMTYCRTDTAAARARTAGHPLHARIHTKIVGSTGTDSS